MSWTRYLPGIGCPSTSQVGLEASPPAQVVASWHETHCTHGREPIKQRCVSGRWPSRHAIAAELHTSPTKVEMADGVGAGRIIRLNHSFVQDSIDRFMPAKATRKLKALLPLRNHSAIKSHYDALPGKARLRSCRHQIAARHRQGESSFSSLSTPRAPSIKGF
jgi:hypothetical protein